MTDIRIGNVRITFDDDKDTPDVPFDEQNKYAPLVFFLLLAVIGIALI